MITRPTPKSTTSRADGRGLTIPGRAPMDATLVTRICMTTKHTFHKFMASLLVVFCLTQLAGAALDPSQPPGGNFNLTNWYLGLPVDSTNGTAGNSASISAAQLTGGYSNALYFYTAPGDGAMTFWAPVTGATTSGSSYPRSELREQIRPPSNTSNWLAYGNHILSAQCRVTQVPSTSKVIIGQIHGYTGAARPLIKLQISSGVIEALVKTNSNYDADFKYVFQNVGVSNLINYQIKMENGLLTLTVNGSNQIANVFLTDPDWATNTMYFKAGSYCQDNTGPTNEGGRVAFYALSLSHAPSITYQPAGRILGAGSNTTFSVSATGNGLLRYQWRLHETNNLASATNATLTLTNVQLTNAGDYTVKVTDSLGAVTSAVAGLTVLLPPSLTAQPTNQTVVAAGSVSFGVGVTGSAPLSYQWYFNTNTPLAHATNATLLLTGVGLSNAGVYSVVVTNPVGAVASSFATLVVNRPPVPGSYATVTGQQIPVATTIASLLAAASDPDGDSLSLTGVSPLSTNGGAVWLANPVVWYAPAPGVVGSDAWSYVLTDARGASATGVVNVTIISSNAITLNPLGQTRLADGAFVAAFQGVPGLRYGVDRATNVDGPWELDFTNAIAAPNGLFEIADPNQPPAPQRFYRTHYP